MLETSPPLDVLTAYSRIDSPNGSFQQVCLQVPLLSLWSRTMRWVAHGIHRWIFEPRNARSSRSHPTCSEASPIALTTSTTSPKKSTSTRIDYILWARAVFPSPSLHHGGGDFDRIHSCRALSLAGITAAEDSCHGHLHHTFHYALLYNFDLNDEDFHLHVV